MRRARPLYRAAAVFALALVAAVTLVLLTRNPAPASGGAAQPEALANIARKNDAAALDAAMRMKAESEARAEAVDRARRRGEAALTPESVATAD